LRPTGRATYCCRWRGRLPVYPTAHEAANQDYQAGHRPKTDPTRSRKASSRGSPSARRPGGTAGRTNLRSGRTSSLCPARQGPAQSDVGSLEVAPTRRGNDRLASHPRAGRARCRRQTDRQSRKATHAPAHHLDPPPRPPGSGTTGGRSPAGRKEVAAVRASPEARGRRPIVHRRLLRRVGASPGDPSGHAEGENPRDSVRGRFGPAAAGFGAGASLCGNTLCSRTGAVGPDRTSVAQRNRSGNRLGGGLRRREGVVSRAGSAHAACNLGSGTSAAADGRGAPGGAFAPGGRRRRHTARRGR